MSAVPVPGASAAPAEGRLSVTIVAANPFEFDSRFLRSATSLAEDGHRLRILGWSAPGLPAEEELAPGVRLTRLDIDRRISSALKPLPWPLRRLASRLVGLDPEARVLPADAPRGLDRLRHPLRRTLEVVANARRAGPWAEAVVATAPETDVFHAQSLIVLPVVRRAARRLGGRFVYDVADYHSEAARLARMPWLVREVVRRRERDWARDASGFLAVSDPVADLVVRRWGVPRPTVLWNCPPAWRPDHPEPVPSDRIRATTGIETERPIVLYQGGFSVDRGVEELIAAATSPRLMELGAAVVFMGYGRLETHIADAVAAHPGRVYLLPAVRPDDLMPWTASADVCFVGQPPRTLNQKMNLPNKLFESMMAGVPVVVSEGNEQCRLTAAEAIGVCVDIDDAAAVAAACASLLSAPLAERRTLRAHCRSVALARYTWDHTAVGLVELYRKLAREGRAATNMTSGAAPIPGAPA
ncbi:MAG TPA: glycosyltransferase family 4 protein [Candidatus Deferrimicrobium sp.]|nr:glycosyltransferase family 4 protein [Candidatus Deferrimicrobium sp.]